MKAIDHAALQTMTRQVLLMETQRTGLANQLSALKRDGVPDVVLSEIAVGCKALKREVDRRKRHLARSWKTNPVLEWSQTVHGLGDAVALVLGLAPPLSEFATPSKFWKYAGFAPDQGTKKGQNHRYNHELHSIAIVRLAMPCMKLRASPYRAVYDNRRARTVLTHPDWTDGHCHMDALRITAKAILLDMWLVAHGKRPREGHHQADTQPTSAALGHTHAGCTQTTTAEEAA